MATDAPVSPVRDLRSVTVLGRAAAAMCGVAACGEAFRYVLLVRGRTRVLPAGQVVFSDALVVAAGWGSLLLALATALAFLPAVARTGAWAAHRAGVGPMRSPLQRLWWMAVPGWNLYGAGVVVSEIDAVLRMAAPVAESTPGDRLRWQSGRLPDVPVPAMPTAVPTPAGEPAVGSAAVPPADLQEGTQPGTKGGRRRSARERWAGRLTTRAWSARVLPGRRPVGGPDDGGPAPRPVHRAPSRLIGWWWAAWVVSGLLALVTVGWRLRAGSLQARADLVELHVLVDVVAAVCAALTAVVARSWSRLIEPGAEVWPAGWILAPSPSPLQPALPSAQPAASPAGP